MVKKLQRTISDRKPSIFPTQNNSVCKACGWEGDDMPYKGNSSIRCCPECGGVYFRAVLKPEYTKLPPVDRKAPFEGERKHRYEKGWRFY